MIKVYSSEHCMPCHELKKWLKENDIPYVAVPYSREAYQKIGIQHLPTVDIDGERYTNWWNGEIRKAIKDSKYYSN